MKVVLDSSTLVSAFISPAGSPAALLVHASQGAFSLYVSEEILAETTRALLRQRIAARYGHTPKDVARFLALITQTAQVVSDLPELPAISRDPNDDVIIACSLKAGANYLVTGDNDLLSLGSYEDVLFVTPRQFLDLL